MTKKEVTPSAAGRQERNEKICKLYGLLMADGTAKELAYNVIARKVKCSHMTVRRVLRKAEMI